NLPLLRLYSYTYQVSGTRFGVVHSIDGYDEISLTAEFKVAMPEKEKIYTPEMLGFERCTHEDLWGGDTPEEASRIFDAVLNNTATAPQRNCVLANSAFAIQVICPQKSIEECLAEARESLESGKALAVLKQFLEING
ncbi:MAG: anthranilate phosphoribosyltransferase, partial [Tannerella sp.]|nr:anthranilate phosphoribosyltransferase [Tannerella sp.]